MGVAALSVGASLYTGITSANAQKAAQAQTMANQARIQKQADARQPNTAAIMAAAQAKMGSSSGTNLTGGSAAAAPLGGGNTLLGG